MQSARQILKTLTTKQRDTLNSYYQNKYKYDKQGRSKSSKSVFIVGDMHCGANTALMSEPISKDHKLIRDFWYELKDHWVGPKKATVLVINGEPINGTNKKNNGAENWTSDINVQLDEAEKLIKAIPYQHVMLTRGSTYHSTDGWTNYEEMLARKLGAIKYVGMFGEALKEHRQGKELHYGIADPSSRQHTDFYLWLGIADNLFSITHHVGYNRWFQYRTTAIASEMANIDKLRGKYFPANMECTQIIRSHVHYLVSVKFGTQWGATTPAWKLADGFNYRSGIASTNTNIGGIEIVIEQNGEISAHNDISMPKHRFPKYKIQRF